MCLSRAKLFVYLIEELQREVGGGGMHVAGLLSYSNINC